MKVAINETLAGGFTNTGRQSKAGNPYVSPADGKLELVLADGTVVEAYTLLVRTGPAKAVQPVQPKPVQLTQVAPKGVKKAEPKPEPKQDDLEARFAKLESLVLKIAGAIG